MVSRAHEGIAGGTVGSVKAEDLPLAEWMERANFAL